MVNIANLHVNIHKFNYEIIFKFFLIENPLIMVIQLKWLMGWPGPEGETGVPRELPKLSVFVVYIRRNLLQTLLSWYICNTWQLKSSETDTNTHTLSFSQRLLMILSVMRATWVSVWMFLRKPSTLPLSIISLSVIKWQGSKVKYIYCHLFNQKGLKTKQCYSPLCYIYFRKWGVEEEFRSVIAWRVTLLCSLVVW